MAIDPRKDIKFPKKFRDALASGNLQSLVTDKTNFDKFYRLYLEREAEAEKNRVSFSEPLILIEIELLDIIKKVRRAVDRKETDVQAKRLETLKKKLEGKFGNKQKAYLQKQFALTKALVQKERYTLVDDIIKTTRATADKASKAAFDATIRAAKYASAKAKATAQARYNKINAATQQANQQQQQKIRKTPTNPRGTSQNNKRKNGLGGALGRGAKNSLGRVGSRLDSEVYGQIGDDAILEELYELTKGVIGGGAKLLYGAFKGRKGNNSQSGPIGASSKAKVSTGSGGRAGASYTTNTSGGKSGVFYKSSPSFGAKPKGNSAGTGTSRPGPSGSKSGGTTATNNFYSAQATQASNSTGAMYTTDAAGNNSGAFYVGSNASVSGNKNSSSKKDSIKEEFKKQSIILKKIEKNTGSAAEANKKKAQDDNRAQFASEENASETSYDAKKGFGLTTLGKTVGAGLTTLSNAGIALSNSVWETAKTKIGTAIDAGIGASIAIFAQKIPAVVKGAVGIGGKAGRLAGRFAGPVALGFMGKDLADGGASAEEDAKKSGNSYTSTSMSNSLHALTLGVGSLIASREETARDIDAIGSKVKGGFNYVGSAIGSLFKSSKTEAKENTEQILKNEELIKNLKNGLKSISPSERDSIVRQEDRIRDLEEENAKLLNKALQEGWDLSPIVGGLAKNSIAQSTSQQTSSAPRSGGTNSQKRERARTRTQAKKSGAAKVGVPYSGIGSVSSSFESNGNPGTISTGIGDPNGGKSYGAFQFSSKQGTVDSFLDANPQYKAEFNGLTVGTPAFDNKWKEITNKDSAGFLKAQQEFISNSHYQPQIDKLKKSGIDLSGRGKAVKEAVFSTATQYGPNTNVIQKSLKGKDVSKMSDADIVSSLQDYKAENVDSYFTSLSPRERQKQVLRAQREKSSLLALNMEREQPSDQQKNIQSLKEQNIKQDINSARKEVASQRTSVNAPSQSIVHNYNNSVMQPNLRHTENSFVREQEKVWGII